MHVFRDRRDAGRQLAERVANQRAGSSDAVVFALPRGGVPVAYELATRLRAPLDVIVVRKLGVPGHEELAMGALASGGGMMLDGPMLQMLGISELELDGVIAREAAELERRECAFRGNRPPLELRGKTVYVVDDGLATGATMLAALETLDARRPARIAVAVPCASPHACSAIGEYVDAITCLHAPADFGGVGDYYADFAQTTDAEVRALLESAHGAVAGDTPRVYKAEPRG